MAKLSNRSLMVLLWTAFSIPSYSQSFFMRPDTVLMEMAMKQDYPDHVYNDFYVRNSGRMESIQDSLRKLPIDRCRHPNIFALLFIDENGVMQGLAILTDFRYDRLKKAVISKFMTPADGWVPAFHIGQSAPIIVMAHFNIDPQFSLLEPVSFKGWNNMLHLAQYYKEVGFRIKRCDDSNFYFDSGDKAFLDGDYKSAKKFYLKALERNSLNSDVVYNLAMTMLRLGKTQEACGYFKRCDGNGSDACREAVERHCK